MFALPSFRSFDFIRGFWPLAEMYAPSVKINAIVGLSSSRHRASTFFQTLGKSFCLYDIFWTLLLEASRMTFCICARPSFLRFLASITIESGATNG